LDCPGVIFDEGADIRLRNILKVYYLTLIFIDWRNRWSYCCYGWNFIKSYKKWYDFAL